MSKMSQSIFSIIKKNRASVPSGKRPVNGKRIFVHSTKNNEDVFTNILTEVLYMKCNGVMKMS